VTVTTARRLRVPSAPASASPFMSVLIRAASFHHIDRFIGDRILGLKWNWILEMGGISIVLLSSEWRQRGWKQTETMRISGAKK